MECHLKCFGALSPRDRSLLIRYTDATAAEREALAGELSTSMGALRVRIHDLRQRLHRCVDGCLAGK